jgi:hypothetical protein
MTEVPCRAYVRLVQSHAAAHALTLLRTVADLTSSTTPSTTTTAGTHHGIAPLRAFQNRVPDQGRRCVKRRTRTTNLILLVAPSSVDVATLRLRLESMVAAIGMQECSINQRSYSRGCARCATGFWALKNCCRNQR